MENNLHSKNLYFAFILSVGFLYVAFLIIFFVQIVESCFTNLVIYFGNDINWSKFIFSKDFLISVFGIIFFSILFIKFILGSATNIYLIYKTNFEISKLKFTQKDGVRFITKKGIVFTAGFFNPHIYISNDLALQLTKSEYLAVLLHEEKHKRDLDPLKRFLAKFIKDIIPPLPFKKEVFYHFNLIIELSADEYAGSITSKENIAKALIKIINFKQDLLINSFNEQKERINVLTGSKFFNHKKFIYMVLFLFIILIYPSLFIAKQSFFEECKNLQSCYNEYLYSNKNLVCYINISNVDHTKLESKVLNFSPDLNYSKI